MSVYNIIAESNESTVVAEYTPESSRSDNFQSEAALEREFIRLLTDQGYEYLTIHGEAGLIDKKNIHNNRLQVINQYEETGGSHDTRYDVTILVNGLPLVHVELKRRGVAIREAFNQIKRYQRDSFWAASGLYEYVQIFIISNGTHTKYYSNTTRSSHITEMGDPAFTSQIAKLKYMRTLGISIHEAAAAVIGRRAMELREPLRKEMKHLLSEETQKKHEWSQWGSLAYALSDIPTHKFYTNIKYEDYDSIDDLIKALS